MYNVHRELPLDGIGVPHAALGVVTTDAEGHEVVVPLKTWSQDNKRPLRCPICKLDVFDVGAPPSRFSTPEKIERCRARRANPLHSMARLFEDRGGRGADSIENRSSLAFRVGGSNQCDFGWFPLGELCMTQLT